MNVTITMTGSIEEVTMMLNNIEHSKSMAQKILPLPGATTKLSDFLEPKKHLKKGQAHKKAVDVWLGSEEGGFFPHRRFDSLTAAATYGGMNNPASISYYLKTGVAYKGIYKFYYHGQSPQIQSEQTEVASGTLPVAGTDGESAGVLSE